MKRAPLLPPPVVLAALRAARLPLRDLATRREFGAVRPRSLQRVQDRRAWTRCLSADEERDRVEHRRASDGHLVPLGADGAELRGDAALTKHGQAASPCALYEPDSRVDETAKIGGRMRGDAEDKAQARCGCCCSLGRRPLCRYSSIMRVEQAAGSERHSWRSFPQRQRDSKRARERECPGSPVHHLQHPTRHEVGNRDRRLCLGLRDARTCAPGGAIGRSAACSSRSRVVTE